MWSSRWAPVLTRITDVLIRRDDKDREATGKATLRTQGEKRGHLQARERGFVRNPLCRHLELRLQLPKVGRKEIPVT